MTYIIIALIVLYAGLTSSIIYFFKLRTNDTQNISGIRNDYE